MHNKKKRTQNPRSPNSLNTTGKCCAVDYEIKSKLDNQALAKAKYCPRVAAASNTQKTPKNPRDLQL